MRALVIAATGMNAQSRNLDVIAHNISNINTTGFKRARAEFTDLIYETERARGSAASAGGAVVPEGTHFGMGVRTAAVRAVHLQGQIAETGNRLDIALNGPGWFPVEGADGSTLYQRSGAFNLDAQGRIVNLDGLRLQPTITVPWDATELAISPSGLVSVRVPGQAEPQELGRIALATFVNDVGLTPLGSNLFAPSAASGEAQTGVPGEAGFATLRQGFLEASNVQAVKEITALIAAQRGYEMNSKVIQAADDMASVVSRNMR